MASGVKSFNYQAVEKREAVVKIIEQVYLGLKNGSLELKTQNDKIELSISDPVEVEVSAQVSESNSTLSLEFSWHNPLPKGKRPKLIIEVPGNDDHTKG